MESPVGEKSFISSKVFLYFSVLFVRFAGFLTRQGHSLVYYYLTAIVHVESGLYRLPVELPAVEGIPTIVVNSVNFANFDSLDSRCLLKHHIQAAGVAAGGGGDVDECLVGGHRRAGVAVEAEVLLIADGGHAEDVEGAGAEGRGLGVVIHATQVVGGAAVGREGGGGHAHHAVVGHDDDGRAGGNLLAQLVQRQLAGAVCGGVGAGVLVSVNGEVRGAVVVGGPVVAVGSLTGGEAWPEGLACKFVEADPVADVFVAVLVVERLAVGDVHGFAAARAVAGGLDEVGGVGTAEGDVPAGKDAEAVAGDGDLAAGDGDVTDGKDAIAVGAGGVDGAAADDDNVIVDAVVGGGDVEGAGAEGLAVDGQYVVGAYSIDAVNIVHGHRIAVGQDDVHVAVAVNLAAVADVGADEVPRLLAVLADFCLRAVEGDGAGGIGSSVLSVAEDAFGVDVADEDGLAGAAQLAGREADGDVLVGHGERRAAERCAARGAVVAVLVAEGRVAAAVGERQAHGVAAAGVEHIIIYDTGDEGVAVAAGAGCLVGGDAADAVLRGRSVVAEGDALAGGDGAELFALALAERLGVVAVGERAGSAVVVDRAFGAGAALWGEEAVGDGERALAKAHEAAAIAIAVDDAVEHAALYLHVSADAEAAGIVTAGDGGAADAVGDVALASLPRRTSLADDSGGASAAAADGAFDDEVLNGSAIHVAEGSDVGRAGVADGQRLALSIKRAGERFVARARHAADGDVVGELHGLAAEEILAVVGSEPVAERVPAVGVSDGVLVGAAYRDGSCWAQHQSVERRRVADGAVVGG